MNADTITKKDQRAGSLIVRTRTFDVFAACYHESVDDLPTTDGQTLQTNVLPISGKAYGDFKGELAGDNSPESPGSFEDEYINIRRNAGRVLNQVPKAYDKQLCTKDVYEKVGNERRSWLRR